MLTDASKDSKSPDYEIPRTPGQAATYRQYGIALDSFKTSCYNNVRFNPSRDREGVGVTKVKVCRNMADKIVKRKALLSNGFDTNIREVSICGTLCSIVDIPCFSATYRKKCQMHDTSENKKITKRTDLKVPLKCLAGPIFLN
mgnify:FL=1